MREGEMGAWHRVAVAALVAVLVGACAHGGARANGSFASFAERGSDPFDREIGIGLIVTAAAVVILAGALAVGSDEKRDNEDCKSHQDCGAKDPRCTTESEGHDCVCKAGKCVAGPDKDWMDMRHDGS
jgi:hypothetical protein